MENNFIKILHSTNTNSDFTGNSLLSEPSTGILLPCIQDSNRHVAGKTREDPFPSLIITSFAFQHLHSPTVASMIKMKLECFCI